MHSLNYNNYTFVNVYILLKYSSYRNLYISFTTFLQHEEDNNEENKALTFILSSDDCDDEETDDDDYDNEEINNTIIQPK